MKVRQTTANVPVCLLTGAHGQVSPAKRKEGIMQTIPNELYEGLRKHFTNPPRHGELYHAPPVPLPSGAHWEDRHNALIQQHSIHSGNHDYVLTTDNRLRALGSDSSIPLWAAMALVAANSIEVAR